MRHFPQILFTVVGICVSNPDLVTQKFRANLKISKNVHLVLE